jgi:hypothetical protein
MTENNGKSQRYLLQLGAAFVVTASIPFTSIAVDAATPAEKLSALRAAVDSGHLQLKRGTSDGASASDRLEIAQEGFDKVAFDNSAPADPDSGK